MIQLHVDVTHVEYIPLSVNGESPLRCILSNSSPPVMLKENKQIVIGTVCTGTCAMYRANVCFLFCL